ncbi:MAG: arginine repressor [Clostridia bacterium]|nr:arginine repressor [Clostridia bacterium]
MKNKRHERIISLISENIITTQEELLDYLVNDGFNVTQSTVSRDIKQLRIIKSQDAAGIYRYLPARPTSHVLGDKTDAHFLDMFAKSVISTDFAMNNVVIKCYTGMASSACVAFDTLFGTQILGSLAGDDTIIAVTRDEQGAKELCEKISKLI